MHLPLQRNYGVSLYCFWVVIYNCWSLQHSAHAGVLIPLQLVKISNKADGGNLNSVTAPFVGYEKFGYIRFEPNDRIILRSTVENGSNWQNLMLYKTVLTALRLTNIEHTDLLAATYSNTPTTASIKIYGDGVEHKFPPFLERILQRIQTYFSIYKYQDTSQVRPQQVDAAAVTALKPTAFASTPAATTLSSVAGSTTTMAITGNLDFGAEHASDIVQTSAASITSQSESAVSDNDESAEFIGIVDNNRYAKAPKD